MKIYLHLLTIIILPIILSGCLSVKEQNYKFDYENGLFEMNFHDIRSEKDINDKKDSLTEDWVSLKQALNKKDDFNPNVISVKFKKIYQEGNVLSGTAIYQVQCPKCFPSQLDILKLLYDDGHWEELNDEIFLIVPSRVHLTSTNGTLLKTGKSIVSVWPKDTKEFEFTVSDQNSNDVSLLGKYLNEFKK